MTHPNAHIFGHGRAYAAVSVNSPPMSTCVVVDPDLMDAALRAIDAILEEEDSDNSDRKDTLDLELTLGSTVQSRVRESKTLNELPACRDAGTDYLRAWFLSNLAHPFPSRIERQKMAATLNTSPRNVESSFTNWRRRSGWSTIRSRWGGQSRTGMRSLIHRYEAGTLDREVSDAIFNMRSYFASATARSCIEEVSWFPLRRLTIW